MLGTQTAHARHYNAEPEHEDARQYFTHHHNLLVTPGAASFESLKLTVCVYHFLSTIACFKEGSKARMRGENASK